jgi:DNA repair ATPase RecN
MESRKRDEIQCRIDEEKKRLSQCESRLSKLESSNEAYAKMVKEAEVAYKKIEESSMTLLHVMKRESKAIQKDLSGGGV